MKTLLLTVSAALALAAAPASAVELVVNGGFETGDFTGWQQFGNTSFTGVADFAASEGEFGAFFGPVGRRGGIRQTLDTVAGQAYRLTFDLQNNSGEPINNYGVFVDGVTQIVVQNAPAFDFTMFTFIFTALDDATTLAFRFRHDPSSFYLDNISVVEVPEPATWGMMIAGFGLVGLGLRKRRPAVVSA